MGKVPEFSENTRGQHVHKILHRHMISYGRQCIIDWTYSNPHLTLDIHIPDQSNSLTRHSGVRDNRRQKDTTLRELLTSLLSSHDNVLQRYDIEGHLCIWFQIEKSNKQLESVSTKYSVC